MCLALSGCQTRIYTPVAVKDARWEAAGSERCSIANFRKLKVGLREQEARVLVGNPKRIDSVFDPERGSDAWRTGYSYEYILVLPDVPTRDPKGSRVVRVHFDLNDRLVRVDGID
jgi:hypothetical protein